MNATLNERVQFYAAQGYMVVHQTDTAAQLRRPKQFNVPLAIVLALLSVGLLLIVYVLIYIGKQDEFIYISVDESGNISESGTGVTASRSPVGWESRVVGMNRAEIAAELQRASQDREPSEYIWFLKRRVESMPPDGQ